MVTCSLGDLVAWLRKRQRRRVPLRTRSHPLDSAWMRQLRAGRLDYARDRREHRISVSVCVEGCLLFTRSAASFTGTPGCGSGKRTSLARLGEGVTSPIRRPVNMNDEISQQRTAVTAAALLESATLLSIDSRRDGSTHTISLCGELDLASVDDVQHELLRVERSDARRIVLDLSGLSFMDSSGVHLVAHARSGSPQLRIVRGPPQRLASLRLHRPARTPARVAAP
jgi:anti-anti-sigma factor